MEGLVKNLRLVLGISGLSMLHAAGELVPRLLPHQR